MEWIPSLPQRLFFCSVKLHFEEVQNGKYSLLTHLKTCLGCFRIYLRTTSVLQSSLDCPKLSPCSCLAVCDLGCVFLQRTRKKIAHLSAHSDERKLMIILLHPLLPLCRKNWSPGETCPSQCEWVGITLVGTADACVQFGPFSFKSWFKGRRGSVNPFYWFLWFQVAVGQHWQSAGFHGMFFSGMLPWAQENQEGEWPWRECNSKNNPNSCRFPAAAVQNLWELWKQSAQHQTRRKT